MVAVGAAVAVAAFIKSRLRMSSLRRAELATEKQPQTLFELIQFTVTVFHLFHQSDNKVVQQRELLASGSRITPMSPRMFASPGFSHLEAKPTTQQDIEIHKPFMSSWGRCGG